MAYQARRLRVQIPCGVVSVVDEPPEAAAGAGQPEAALPRVAAFCWPSRRCHWRSFFGEAPEEGDCGGDTVILDDTPTIVEVEALALARRDLEAKLAELDAAQAAVDEAGGGAA